MKRTVWVDEEDMEWGCWLNGSGEYSKLGGRAIHQQFASGEGYLVRHLCCDSYCINPRHLLRGNEQENALDEVFRRGIEDKLREMDLSWARDIRIGWKRFIKIFIETNGLRLDNDILYEQKVKSNDLMWKLKHNKVRIMEVSQWEKELVHM